MEPREARGRPDERLLRLRIEKLPPELNGLSNGDWAWHGALRLHGVHRAGGGRQRGPARRAAREGRARSRQTPPWTIDADAKPYLRTTKRRANAMLARPMGNLGFVSTALSVRYGDVPAVEDDPYRYYRW